MCLEATSRRGNTTRTSAMTTSPTSAKNRWPIRVGLLVFSGALLLSASRGLAGDATTSVHQLFETVALGTSASAQGDFPKAPVPSELGATYRDRGAYTSPGF